MTACVTISGGDVINETVIDLSADARHGHLRCQRGQQQPGHHQWRQRWGSVDTASAGNGGVATAAANGGAISTGNINSGGNVGNAISVGDTYCDALHPNEAPARG